MADFRIRLLLQKCSHFSCVCKRWLSAPVLAKWTEGDVLILIEIWICKNSTLEILGGVLQQRIARLRPRLHCTTY